MEENGNFAPADERKWAMFAHLSGLVWILSIPGIIGPLIIWSIKKDQMPFVEAEGKEAINFQISLLIYALVSLPLCFVVIGFFTFAATIIFGLIFSIIAGVKASEGQGYRYPLTLRLIQ